MIDHISYTEANSFFDISIPGIIFVIIFALVFCLERYESKKQARKFNFLPVISISVIGAFCLGALASVKEVAHWGAANKNLQTIKAFEIEASDLNVELHPFIQQGADKIQTASENRGLGAFDFLTEKPLDKLYKTDFLTMDEFIVAKQYLENCYPGEAGQAAREYLSLYPAEGRILSKKLVKAQSLTPENEIQKDCLNSVSLTFLE